MSRLYVRLEDEAKLVIWQRDEVAVERGTVADLVKSAVRRMRSKAPPDGVDLAYGPDLLQWREIAQLPSQKAGRSPRFSTDQCAGPGTHPNKLPGGKPTATTASSV